MYSCFPNLDAFYVHRKVQQERDRKAKQKVPRRQLCLLSLGLLLLFNFYSFEWQGWGERERIKINQSCVHGFTPQIHRSTKAWPSQEPESPSRAPVWVAGTEA